MSSQRSLRVLFVKMQATALSVRAYLTEARDRIEIHEVGHVQAACSAIAAAPPDLVVVDERLAGWDLQILQEHHSEVVLAESSTAPWELAMKLESRFPGQRPPSL